MVAALEEQVTAEAEIGEASWEMATPVGEMVDAAVADMGGQTAARDLQARRV